MRSLTIGILAVLLLSAPLAAAENKENAPASGPAETDSLSEGHWWRKQVGHFTVTSDKNNRAAYGQILRHLEESRALFLLYFPVFKQKEAIAGTVRIFRRREDYLACVGKKYEWSAGVWDGKEMLISPSPEKISAKEQKKRIREIVYHEGFHFFLDTAVGRRSAGLWFHEGGAQLFDEQERGRIRPDDAMLSRLEKTVKESALPVAELMVMPAGAFQQEQGRSMHYDLSCALLFYLLKGAPSEKSPFSALPGDYLQLLMQNKSNDEALTELSRKYDPEKLETEFRAFWRSSARIRRAAKYEPKEENTP